MSTRLVSPLGRLFVIVALFEGLTWAGLLLGMWLKYGPVGSVVGVRWFGPLHGGAFLLYLAVTVLAGARLRWPWWAWTLAVLAALPPLLTVPLEWWFRRIGLLAAPATPAVVGTAALEAAE